MPNYTYPLDLTGKASTNFIANEAHTASSITDKTYHIVIPEFAPFHLDNFTMKLTDALGATTVLFEGIDYEFCVPYVTASDSIGKYIYGGIKLLKNIGDSTLLVSYQTLGDKWMGSASYVLERIAEKLFNPRTVIWDNITNVQETFPATDHTVDLNSDIASTGDILTKLQQIADAILAGPSATNQVIKHILDESSNPHKVNKEQIGIQMASDIEVANAEQADKHITLRQLIVHVIVPLQNEIQNLTNEINALKQQIQ